MLPLYLCCLLYLVVSADTVHCAVLSPCSSRSLCSSLLISCSHVPNTYYILTVYSMYLILISIQCVVLYHVYKQSLCLQWYKTSAGGRQSNCDFGVSLPVKLNRQHFSFAFWCVPGAPMALCTALWLSINIIHKKQKFFFSMHRTVFSIHFLFLWLFQWERSIY